jgi:small conductance mechanosensitive channel
MDKASLNAFLIQWQTILAELGLRLLGAIALFFIGRWAARLLQRTIRNLLNKTHVEVSLISFASNLTYYGAIAFITLAIMGALGIETTSLVAILGATSVAIGLALQGSLANFAAGLLIVIFHPFRVGDWIESGGISGIVEEIQLFTTHVRTFDNKIVIIPNGRLTNDTVTNFTSKGILRVDLMVSVGYQENLQQVKQSIAKVLEMDSRILTEPRPTIGVSELGANSIRIAIQPWTDARNYWLVYHHTYEKLVEQFNTQGISIPLPDQKIYIQAPEPTSTS